MIVRFGQDQGSAKLMLLTTKLYNCNANILLMLWAIDCIEYLGWIFAIRAMFAQKMLCCHHFDQQCINVYMMHKGQVTKLRLSCYLVLLSIDSKTR